MSTPWPIPATNQRHTRCLVQLSCTTTLRLGRKRVANVEIDAAARHRRPSAANTWNEIRLDVSGWAGRSPVDRVELAMWAFGANDPTCNPHFQLDSAGWCSPDA
ncbi:hypothetical protein [Haloactinopolyspora alba]|uniref:hypothetical protein n=1 Tax=Haloactinopolyspora alba TaxID=648780 RepID=UPI00101C0F4F|nr:hypothetical protein [Haloactinopolyspora alba]